MFYSIPRQSCSFGHKELYFSTLAGVAHIGYGAGLLAIKVARTVHYLKSFHQLPKDWSPREAAYNICPSQHITRGLLLLIPVIGSIFFHFYDRHEDGKRPSRYLNLGKRKAERETFTFDAAYYYELAAEEYIKLCLKEKALECYLSAAKIAESRRGETLAVGFREKAGDLLMGFERFQEAGEVFWEIDNCVSNETAKPVFLKAGEAYHLIAQKSAAESNWKNAIDMYQRASHCYVRASEPAKETEQYQAILNIHLERGNFFIREEDFVKAIESHIKALFVCINNIKDEKLIHEVKAKCLDLHEKVAMMCIESEEWLAAGESYSRASYFCHDELKKLELEQKMKAAYLMQAQVVLQKAKHLEFNKRLKAAISFYQQASLAFFLAGDYKNSGEANASVKRVTSRIAEEERLARESVAKNAKMAQEERQRAEKAAREAALAKEAAAINEIKELVNKPDRLQLVNLLENSSDLIIKKLIFEVEKLSIKLTKKQKLFFYLNTHPDKVTPLLEKKALSKMQSDLLTALTDLANSS